MSTCRLPRLATESLAEEAAANPDIQYILDSQAAYRAVVDDYRAELGNYGFGFNKD